jgi:hypothetical protein
MNADETRGKKKRCFTKIAAEAKRSRRLTELVNDFSGRFYGLCSHLD